ncbi:hypothetical protein T261_8306 [Streptomyces lydicus]|nr:hypothetical protein T261_8306 [Streptomyces lydicus]
MRGRQCPHDRGPYSHPVRAGAAMGTAVRGLLGKSALSVVRGMLTNAS